MGGVLQGVTEEPAIGVIWKALLVYDFHDDNDEDDIAGCGPENQRQVSWIWRLAGREGTDAALETALQVEWSKAFARTRRWTEEHTLLVEEYRCISLSFDHEAARWAARAAAVPSRGTALGAARPRRWKQKRAPTMRIGPDWRRGWGALREAEDGQKQTGEEVTQGQLDEDDENLLQGGHRERRGICARGVKVMMIRVAEAGGYAGGLEGSIVMRQPLRPKYRARRMAACAPGAPGLNP
ncbi:hypothetical protein MVEN_02285200 [Mycena venus]|uniref:Uncharacterized protein n=1 Tax=Mycena venus TaxID=2733690 RepID=A0A8H6X569_9AGAR|nr:hypothetical protein MVEN_02285200 [Mycena venus]